MTISHYWKCQLRSYYLSYYLPHLHSFRAELSGGDAAAAAAIIFAADVANSYHDEQFGKEQRFLGQKQFITDTGTLTIFFSDMRLTHDDYSRIR